MNSPSDRPSRRTVNRDPAHVESLDADVCVIGSGAAGAAAALETASAGLSVILVEAAEHLGGQAVGSSIGTVCGLYGNGPDPARVTHGLLPDLVAAMVVEGSARPRRARNTVIISYEPSVWARRVEDALVGAGVVPMTGAVVTEVRLDGPSVSGVRVATRWGAAEIRADNWIDASGDAVLPWLAGLPVFVPDPPILGSVMAVLGGVGTEMIDGLPRSVFHRLVEQDSDRELLPRLDGFVFSSPRPGEVLMNMTHVPTPTDPVGATRAGIEGRRQVDRLLEVFRRGLPEAFGRAFVVNYGGLGIRQTRTISGRATLTTDDVRRGHRPDDAVARCSWPIELHTRTAAADWEEFGDDHMHFVPLGAMLPAGLDNVITAGRCIDAETAALASVRVMGPCMAMGRAAAEVVRLAGTDPYHQVDVARLQANLRENLNP
ncbi:MAG TPA: FAD-dependent oxidoreductase [Acidimicrobiales bacterium]|nr:FAD-dependent oxidoreductase [Acidimicrobiales bacterium]